MTNENNDDRDRGDANEPVRGDRLDSLLQAWHDENSAAARAKRDEILRSLAAQERARRRTRPGMVEILARIGSSRAAFSRVAAAAILIVVAALFVSMFVGPSVTREAKADDSLMQVAEGGALEAIDPDGNPLGACPLRHTDVSVEITGPFARTVVEQTYTNPFPRTIEAVYTFPLSNRAAVDRMSMVVRGASGERIVEGEVKERSLARAIYEEARESGYVASLLEQERPNIFTQSVANIEPGATVKVRIATIETVERKDGVAQYAFPMVVGPRYIPGKSAPSTAAMPKMPDGWTVREGIVLRGPARIEVEADAVVSAKRLERLLAAAIPARAESAAIDALLAYGDASPFLARYANGSAERGFYSLSASIGSINGRFFFVPEGAQAAVGTGFATATGEVPDADRITPMPVRPPTRAGHDISIKVTLDTLGAPLGAITSDQHEVRIESAAPTRRVISLVDQQSIPNRDFSLRWESRAAAVEPAFFAHTSDASDADAKGGFFALMLDPPARIAPSEIRPRELVFVLDVSGSMNGFPIEKSKELARKAIARMRPNDTFNVITFAGNTAVLWPEPKPATAENVAAADRFIAGTSGGGGTEMMAAITAALVQPGRSGLDPAALLALPADGRNATIAVPAGAISLDGARWKIDAGAGADGARRVLSAEIPVVIPENPRRLALLLEGSWTTKDSDRVFVARSARFEDSDARTRLVLFLTDGYIGNDQAIVQAVRDNARASRVFSFGIGSSVNRFLLDEMARAGRGVSETVTLAEDADAVVERLVRRIDAPVLTDLEIAVDPALGIRDLLPAGGRLPDLYDVEPLLLIGRFDRAARGSITLRGRTGGGAWERTVAVDLPEREMNHEVVPALWARAKVDDLLLPKLAAVEDGSLDAPTRRAVVRLGEAFHITTPFTSFVAVEKSRVVVGGKPMLVSVPVELPSGTNWNGIFGEGAEAGRMIRCEARGERGDRGEVAQFGRALGERAFAVEPSQAPSEPVIAAAAAEPSPGSFAAPAAGESSERRVGREAGAPAFAARRAAESNGDARPTGGKGELGGVAGKRAPAGAPVMRSGKPGASAAPADPGMPGGGGFGGGAATASRPPSDGSVAEKSDSKRKDEFGANQAPSPMRAPRLADAQADETRIAKTEALHSSADGSKPGADGAARAPIALDRATRDTLARVLERRLVIVALAVILGESERIPGLAAELDLPLDDGTLLVAMRIAKPAGDAAAAAPGDDVRSSLQSLGCVIAAEDRGRGLVVARIPPAALPGIARLKGVLRVEPTSSRSP